jgi:hypothetical protein
MGRDSLDPGREKRTTFTRTPSPDREWAAGEAPPPMGDY